MSTLRAPGFPEQDVRRRAREGGAAVFPAVDEYGASVFGADATAPGDGIDAYRLVPPVFMPRRLEKLIDLGREPLYADVSLRSSFGGFDAPLPLYLSALGSTRVAAAGSALARQAGRLGLPMVIGENVAPVRGFRSGGEHHALLARIGAYTETVPDGTGGVVVQQSTEDANAEVWNNVYTDPSVLGLMDTGRLAFELKVGQGAKPGLGGLTMVDEETSRRLDGQYAMERLLPGGPVLRCSSPGTFTAEILRQQVHLMRNNYPRARCWVKLPPGRDVAEAAAVAWRAGADAVTVDGAEGGTGWAPSAFLGQVGLPLRECLRRIGTPQGALLASGRVHDGVRALKVLALGASAAGLGRAALVAVDEDAENGLVRLVESIALEMRFLVSALGKYTVGEAGPEDLWDPYESGPAVTDHAPSGAGGSAIRHGEREVYA
ncbi:glutamate synthase-related protein [Actinomadura sp. DC4]|uniref:glutamate synthase-related protein n=1 Tax=Actinomadura sp. DC4 TaxID=3055069 RepID=UPI0025B0F659|nr:glutamate synthase-related protein [Actinomadura sp. DC4]MDN3356437.1 glutamate synthase-related protein [Actinomadura sp. DC4]